MANPKLTFNVLTFDHPAPEYTFYFYKEDGESLKRIFHTLVPREVIDHFGQQDHYYTSFEEKLDGALALTRFCKPQKTAGLDKNRENLPDKNKADSAFSKSVMKRFYAYRIHTYFKRTGLMVKTNFVDDIQIWLPAEISNPTFTFFDKYTLKIQIAVVTNQPEILVTYEGQSKVFRKGIDQLLSEVSSDCFNWVIFENNLYKYEDLSEDARRNYSSVFPVLNFELRDALHLRTEAPDRSNPYIKYKRHINLFFENYLNNEAFKKIIPIDCKSFIPVKDKDIGSVSENTNLLLFGKSSQHVGPHKGMDAFGPLELPRDVRIQFFYIYHTSHLSSVKELHTYFDKGMQTEDGTLLFKGMLKYAGVPFSTESKFSISFNNIDDPIPEIEETMRHRDFKDEVQYIAIYISPHSKNGSTTQQKSIYYKIKELLLKQNIASQVIEHQKIKFGKSYSYSLNNIAIAVLAKLNGVPWRLNVKVKNELVIGVGAFKNSDSGVQYIGSAFSFSNNGRFNHFDCFMKNEVDELAGSIIQAVKEYVAVQNSPSRLIIHFYKQMNSRELDIIEDCLSNLGLKIPVFIVSINKTESEDIVAFDNSWTDLMPQSGTFINIGYGRYLLFNNTRYPNAYFSNADGYPFPIKLYMKCTDPELLKEYKTVKELLDQIYQFSRMYWKSVRQQNLPVTIKYPEMVAEMYPHFEGRDIEYGKDKLWFL